MSDLKVKEWLTSYPAISTRNSYRSSFKHFEQFTGKTGARMLAEAREFIKDPDKADTYPALIMRYHQHLLETKAQKTGSIEGRAGGTTGEYKNKNLAQTTARFGVAVVQAFFAYFNLPLNLRKFKRKNKTLQRARPEQKKHQLTTPEIQSLFKVASLRDKCVLALGLMGQDESTIASLRTEQFEDKLGGRNLEFVDLVRPKTNTDILLILMPEIQELLKAYIQTIKPGWLFPGYNDKHFQNGMPDKIFKALCQKAGLKDNGHRISFHCCRLWFSSVLRNRVSDDLIDLMTGHVLRFDGAYVPDNHEEIKKGLLDAGIISMLRLQRGPSEADLINIDELKQDYEHRIRALEEKLNTMIPSYALGRVLSSVAKDDPVLNELIQKLMVKLGIES